MDNRSVFENGTGAPTHRVVYDHRVAPGGGGGSIPPVPPAQSTADIMAQLMPFFQMMQQQNAALIRSMARMQRAVPPPPKVEMPEPIDFTEQQKTLEARAKGKRAVELARKYGRTDTIHAPLLYDDPETTSTVTNGLLFE